MTNEPYLLVVVVLREGIRVGLEEEIWMGGVAQTLRFLLTLTICISSIINSQMQIRLFL